MGLIKMNGVNYWGSAYGQGIIAPMIYSTEEKEVGVWTDGKPLYQKTVHVGALVQDSSWHGVSHGVANLDKCINIEAICIASNGTEFYPINLYRPTTSTGVMVYATASDVYYMNNYYSEMDDAYFTIQYTKTTDTAGSGIYTPSGALAVHYSTNEQVVGTWIDGKPLYEKTLNPTVNIGGNTFNHGISNFKECIRIYGKCKYNNGSDVLPLPYASTNINYVIALGNVSATTYLIETGNGFSSIQDCYVTIQYTKTTDV